MSDTDEWIHFACEESKQDSSSSISLANCCLGESASEGLENGKDQQIGGRLQFYGGNNGERIDMSELEGEEPDMDKLWGSFARNDKSNSLQKSVE